MSKEEIDGTEESTEESTEEGADKTGKTVAPTGGANNPLSRGTDYIAKPGFRNPSNKRSKASKKRRKKK